MIRPQYGLPRAHAGRLGGGSHLPPVEACEVRGYREGHQGRDPWGGGDRGGIGDVSDQLTYTLYIYIYYNIHIHMCIYIYMYNYIYIYV